MKGILADANVIGQVEHLVARMRAEPWIEFWNALGISLWHFADVGLLDDARDVEIWRACQEEQLVLLTNNRNHDSLDSLEATIREQNTDNSLPVFTIADIGRLRTDRVYTDRVVESLYAYLFDIDKIRGAGRLYLP